MAPHATILCPASSKKSGTGEFHGDAVADRSPLSGSASVTSSASPTFT